MEEVIILLKNVIGITDLVTVSVVGPISVCEVECRKVYVNQ